MDSPQRTVIVSLMANDAAPPSASAKPAVEVIMAAVQVTGMPEAVVTAGRVLHESGRASVLSSKGQYRSRNIDVHINEGPMRQHVLHTLTSLVREPRRDWRRPRGSARAGACE